MKLCWNIDWTLPWRFRRKELFHLCLSLAHLLTLCHIEATSRRKGSTRTDPPALQGYHHSPPPSSPLISSAFALWANAELYILGPSLPFFLSFFLPPFLPFFLWQKVGNICQYGCLYVCQSASWLTSLLKLGQYRRSTSWVLHFLSPFLSFFLPFFLSPKESWKNLSILMLGLWNFAWGIPGHNH